MVYRTVWSREHRAGDGDSHEIPWSSRRLVSRRRGARGTANAELGQTAAQGVGVHVEQARGAAGAVDHPLGSLEHLKDVIPLDLFQSQTARTWGCRGRRRGSRAVRTGQHFWIELEH